ncbi:hypothetical protein PUR57_05340 [Streptomyces sp. JV176]|uniref:hypothetical protein n=1 Tax=Streptomyces sp. JV176 TaxID=858630 RepID=UPI002E78F8D6|nr:hypothetical protein [Streptomyces sp. JV176]MEE1798106.1 hypothetical protein [Streptomyces sp. JV176]
MTARNYYPYPYELVGSELLWRADSARQDASNLMRTPEPYFEEVLGRGAHGNTLALGEIVEDRWPSEALVGRDAAGAALLLAALCLDPELQERCRGLLHRSVQRGESPLEHLQALGTICQLNQTPWSPGADMATGGLLHHTG